MSEIRAERLERALASSDSSARLQAALAAGTHPDPDYIEVLVRRCAIEPDFYVRDMMTWALTRHPAELTVPRLLAESMEHEPQAQSQALHSLSKIRDPRGWLAITTALLQDPDDEVARSAWRAAVVLVPAGHERELAATLATQLGRGDRSLHLSLSRALSALGDAASPVLSAASVHGSPDVRAHAIATVRMIDDPDEGFDQAIFEAKRTVALKDIPIAGDAPDDRDVEP